MTLEEFAYFGEIVAAVAVIASLIYVARQLRQNTAIMRVNAASERLERFFEITSPVIEDRHLAEIWMKGASQFDELDEVDRQRLILFERRAISLWHHVYQMRQQNLYSGAEWHATLWVIQNPGRRQTMRRAWQDLKGGYQRSFQAFIDGQFEITDGAGYSG